MSRLLVSVRDADEAEVARAGGAHLVDVKEPERGSLGRADDAVVETILERVGMTHPVSAARGELLESEALELPESVSRLSFLKWGLAGMRDRAWRPELESVWEQLREEAPACRPVAVAYADDERAESPSLEEVASFALERVERFGCALLLDTHTKDGSTLLDWVSLPWLVRLGEKCLASGVPLALAGSLDGDSVRRIASAVRPDWFAVRGAACATGDRRGRLDSERVRTLVEMLG